MPDSSPYLQRREGAPCREEIANAPKTERCPQYFCSEKMAGADVYVRNSGTCHSDQWGEAHRFSAMAK